MSKRKAQPTEPQPVPDLFVTAVTLDGTAEYIRLTGWVAHDVRLAPAIDGPELRIVARLVMPRSTARELLQGLKRRAPQGNGG